MKTPITDAVEQTITIDCDDSCVSIYVYESDKIYEGGLVPSRTARLLELDRAALIEALELAHGMTLNLVTDAHNNKPWHPNAASNLRIAADAMKSALSATRANFPEL